MNDPSPAYKMELRDLYKHFGPNKVLNGVNLTVPQGQSVVVIGGSGSGKSVMMKCILGLLHPDAGSILVDGQETVGLDGRARNEMMHKFGMLFQGGALFDSMKIWENVAFGLVQGQGMKRSDARDIARAKLKSVGLRESVEELYPAELSGGMQKRVSLARAIATDPEIIFFDEPTTGLDPIMADVIDQLIVETVKNMGATALTITHDMHSVRKIADQVAMIYNGQIMWQDDVEKLDNSGNEYVDQFINGKAHGPITDDLGRHAA